MSSNLKVIDYLEIASSLNNISLDLQEIIKITYDPINLVNPTTFRDRLKREMNEIECTPTKEGPTIKEIRRFFDEELPLKLQRVNKKSQHKEFNRMNSTLIPNRKDNSSPGSSSNLSATILVNASAPVAATSTSVGRHGSTSSSDKSSAKLSNTEPRRTPGDIYKDYKNIMNKLNELVNEKIDNLKFTDNNIALENTKKIVKDLEKLGDLFKDEDTREPFTVHQEENIKRIGNIISQYVFIQENKDLFTTEIKNYESLDVLMCAVKDLLNEITLIS